MTAYHDLTNLADTLKNVYGKGLQDQFNIEPITYNQFPKSPMKPKGKGYTFGIRWEHAQGVGGRAESQKLPQGLAGKYDTGLIKPTYQYGSLRLTGPAMEIGKGDMAAFVDTLSDSMDDIYKSLVMEMNRQAWCDGYGLIATTSAAGTLDTDSTWELSFDNDKGCMYMRDGMLVDFYIADGTTIDQTSYAAGVRISTVDLVAGTCIMEGADVVDYNTSWHPNSTIAALTHTAAALASGSHMVKMGARDAAWTSSSTTDPPSDMMGLDGIFDDGTNLSVFESLTVASWPKWQANKLGNSSVNRELSLDLMLQAVDLTRFHSTNTSKIQMRMGLGQRRKYAGLLMPDVRFLPTVLKGGYETMTFSAGDGATEIIVDPMNQPNKIYIHPEGQIKKYEVLPLGWGNIGSKMHQRDGYDEYDMFLRLYTNLGVEQRNACTYIADLTEPNIWS